MTLKRSISAAQHVGPPTQVPRPRRAGRRNRVELKLVLSAAAVAALVAGFGAPAQASTSLVASGSFGFAPISVTLVRTVGNTSVYVTVANVPYSGGLSGTAIDTETDFVGSNGAWAGYGTEVCTSCSLGGRTGGYTAVYVDAGLNYFTTGLPAEGYLTFTGGTGELAGLHGGGTFGGNASNPGSYSYNYSFAP